MQSETSKPAILPLELTLPEVNLPLVLPTNVKALTALLRTQHQAHTEVKIKALGHIQHLYEQFVLLRHSRFGSSSEIASAQQRLFDEAEALAAGTTAEQDVAPIKPEPPTVTDNNKPVAKPAHGKRSPLSADLKRVDVIHNVPEAERTCCGTPMVVIGQEISEQLDIVPMQVRVLRHIRNIYGCPSSIHAPVTAALPPQPLPKSNASPDFLAMLLVTKFVDGLPLYRFESILERHGAIVPRQTLARWVIGASNVLQPLYNLILDALFDSPIMHMDETVVQVLKEEGKLPTSQSYMWVRAGGPPDKPVVIFDYDPSRSGDVPLRLLQGYRGYLMVDAYAGYNMLMKIEDIIRLACWAHARRRFVEATRVQSKGKKGLADVAVAMIGKLYAIESEYKDSTDAERLQARQQQSLPVLAQIHAWMVKVLPAVPPKTALGKALSYMRDCWSMLVVYTEHGFLPIDNNRVENKIRPFVMGRKAWLFCDTPAGANASAIIYSLLETAKANGLDPYAWLRRVMRDLPAAKNVEEMEALLPWNLHMQDLIIEMIS
jgi:transposase